MKVFLVVLAMLCLGCGAVYDLNDSCAVEGEYSKCDYKMLQHTCEGLINLKSEWKDTLTLPTEICGHYKWTVGPVWTKVVGMCEVKADAEADPLHATEIVGMASVEIKCDIAGFTCEYHAAFNCIK